MISGQYWARLRHSGCVWINQSRTELKWFHISLSGSGATIERFFSLDAFNRVGTVVGIGTDVSLWGWVDGSRSTGASRSISRLRSHK